MRDRRSLKGAGAIRVNQQRRRAAGSELHAALLAQVQAVAASHGCRVLGIGPPAVNVVGDARSYWPSVIIEFPAGLSWDDIGTISTTITNRVRVSRVLMHVAAKRDEKNASSHSE